MDTIYRIILFIHVCSVIAASGPFFILIPVVHKLRTATAATQDGYLDAFRFSIRLAKHAGHVLVISGLLLVWLGSWSWTTSWLVITVLIMLCSLYFFARAFSPTLRKFNELDRETSVRKLHRAIWVYVLLMLLMLWFMVARPELWT